MGSKDNFHSSLSVLHWFSKLNVGNLQDCGLLFLSLHRLPCIYSENLKHSVIRSHSVSSLSTGLSRTVLTLESPPPICHLKMTRCGAHICHGWPPTHSRYCPVEGHDYRLSRFLAFWTKNWIKRPAKQRRNEATKELQQGFIENESTFHSVEVDSSSDSRAWKQNILGSKHSPQKFSIGHFMLTSCNWSGGLQSVWLVADNNHSEARVKFTKLQTKTRRALRMICYQSPICHAEKVKGSSLWSFYYLGMES